VCFGIEAQFFLLTREGGRGGGVLETSPSEHIQIEGVGVEEREGQSRVKCLKRQTEKERGEKKERRGAWGERRRQHEAKNFTPEISPS